MANTVIQLKNSGASGNTPGTLQPGELAINYAKKKKIDFEVIGAMYHMNDSGDILFNKPQSYYMYPRSSIYKYPLMAANSVGIIDAGYRGNIMAKVRCFENDTYIAMGSKLFQICAPDLSPLNVKVITSPEDYSMEASQRGRNGFGSSGR